MNLIRYFMLSAKREIQSNLRMYLPFRAMHDSVSGFLEEQTRGEYSTTIIRIYHYYYGSELRFLEKYKS